ncbi:MAG: YjbH domain-containing protein [Candidatus Rhabdochlamydia sp.]
MDFSLKMCCAIFLVSSCWIFAEQNSFFSEKFEENSLFYDLDLISDRLPFIYNYSTLGGYFYTPSARMDTMGTLATNITSTSSFQIYGMGFQFFDRIQVSVNYHIYKGMKKQNTDRIANIKLGLITEQDDFTYLPTLAVGIDDFIGIGGVNSPYIVMSKQFLPLNVECSLGWGRKRLQGIFAGISCSPFRKSEKGFLKNLSFIAEYNSNKEKSDSLKGKINTGLVFSAGDYFQFSLTSLGGKEVAISSCLQFPLGLNQKIKSQDPCLYVSPINTEPLGCMRGKQDFSQEIAYALKQQGLDLYRASIRYNAFGDKQLCLKIINTRYCQECEVRERIQCVLAALTPSDITSILLVIEEGGVNCQAYCFDRKLLRLWYHNQISDYSYNVLVPLQEVPECKNCYEEALIFQRHKPIGTLIIRPRMLTFFGTNNGKFKYNIGAIISPEGYIKDQFYYKVQLGYSISSSMQKITQHQKNPSYLPIVRSDMLSYLRPNRLSLEEAYLQKTWNLGCGWFFRTATGYFEIAYTGIAAECLFYPVNSNWAIGLECAATYKRKYQGITFTNHVKQLKKTGYVEIPFTGMQYFLDIYYDCKPLHVDLQMSIGQFLAKDRGVRIELGRYFPSGLRFSVWMTITNGHDRVNGRIYYDKGFCFVLPLDLFFPRSSRNYLGFCMSAYLRDIGARTKTGISLYDTLYRARYNY